MTGQDGWSRRTVAKGLAAATAAMIVPRRVLGRGVKAPSDTLAIAAVGAGGRAIDDLKGLEHERIVALCDVDWKRARTSFLRYPDAKQYKDFREMLDREQGIDAVLVATPDHTHAVIAMEAIRRGHARLLREAVDAHHPRGADTGEGRARRRRRDADGEPGPRFRDARGRFASGSRPE